MKKTTEQYDLIINACKSIFAAKTVDYGASWYLFRITSITDQIYIKLKRIRSIQEKKIQMIEDTIEEDYMGIINYCIIAQILILNSKKKLSFELDNPNLKWTTLKTIYNDVVKKTKDLVTKKNHDYDEVWRDLRVSSMVDIMLVKIHRIKRIEENNNMTKVSEGINSQYQDILNYAIFCLIIIKG